ncbi:tyrosine-type recombinase/integrase [Murimonas intestini]|uniref:Site-specific recombinase XerD n=2 Tax=Murimonas intestini TaxID=1337051 RepID=A0AB73SXQ6_9FIRM|nr:tyrosine-type recombinase/integrase [Murimonas intestini]MCR1886364.1 tyrosine-type recombinase/integrase [Murimonas intestini]
MTDEFKSIFSNEIRLHLMLRKEELASEAFRHYRHTIKLFDDYLYSINLKEKSIEEPIIDGWIKEISNGISINTVSGHVHFIRQLLLFLIDHGYDCFIPKTIRTRDTYVPYLYTDQDIENIFKTADSFTAPRAVKNINIENEMPLLLRLLFCCGLRVGETINIKVGDIDLKRDLILLRVTKKYKQRLVPFDKKLSEIIYLYCGAMGILNDSEAYLFPSTDRYTPLTANSVGNYYRIIRKKAGIKNNQINKNGRGACLHCFRHTFE